MRDCWVPWQLSPDSDPQERWILVNADDEGEEHPEGRLFDSPEQASEGSKRRKAGKRGK